MSWAFLGSAAVLASYFVGQAALGDRGTADTTATDRADEKFTTAPPAPDESSTAPSTDVLPEPRNLPDCGDAEGAVRFLGWGGATSPTARGAAEELLGKPLPAARVDEVTPDRHDVAIPDGAGHATAVVTVVRSGTGGWSASAVHDCADDMLHLPG